MNVTRTGQSRSNGPVRAAGRDRAGPAAARPASPRRPAGTGPRAAAARPAAVQQGYLRRARLGRALGCGQRSREAGPGAPASSGLAGRPTAKERPQGGMRRAQPVEKAVDHMWGLARDERSMSEADLAEVWARSLDELAEMHIEPAQRAWLQLTRPLGLVENTALIATPNEFVKEQLETRLRSLITNALSRELGRSIQLAVTVDPAVISAMPLSPAGHEHPLPAGQGSPEPRLATDHLMAELDDGR